MLSSDATANIAKARADVIKTNVAVTFIAPFWAILRLYSRKMKGVGLVLEDYMIVGALFFLYATLVSMVLAVVDGGYGHHTTDLTASQIERTLKYTLTTQFCALSVAYSPVFFFTRPFQIAAYTTMALCVCWAIMTCMIGLFICQPLTMNRAPTTAGGHCGSENIAFSVVGVIDLLTDLIILILPLPMIRRLQVLKANKIGLFCIFGLGTITIVMGAIRMSGIFTIDFADFTYAAKQTSI